jgi:hypothetical protein
LFKLFSMGQRNTSKILLQAFNLPATQEKRILPHLDVLKFDRLHFHISNGSMGIANTEVRILFGTQAGALTLLGDSTVWFEASAAERNFKYRTPVTYGETGFIISVPVVAPLLFDVIITNHGTVPLSSLHVSVLMQQL